MALWAENAAMIQTEGEAVVTRALERERRRALAERDARILARTGPDPELAGLAEHAAGLPQDLA